MPTITFINGSQRWTASAVAGTTLMSVALENGVAGVQATCGGCCSCATCHGYVGERGVSVLAPPSEDERMLLEGLDSVRSDSRLLCQVEITDAIDGLAVTVAPHD